jgi:hypothetical protein
MVRQTSGRQPSRWSSPEYAAMQFSWVKQLVNARQTLRRRRRLILSFTIKGAHTCGKGWEAVWHLCNSQLHDPAIA